MDDHDNRIDPVIVEHKGNAFEILFRDDGPKIKAMTGPCICCRDDWTRTDTDDVFRAAIAELRERIEQEH